MWGKIKAVDVPIVITEEVGVIYVVVVVRPVLVTEVTVVVTVVEGVGQRGRVSVVVTLPTDREILVLCAWRVFVSASSERRMVFFICSFWN